MAHIVEWTFAEAYAKLLEEVYHRPEFTASPRGMLVKERIGTSIRVQDPTFRFFKSEARSTPMRYVAGEYLWYFSGSRNLEDIQDFSKFWKKLLNPLSGNDGFLEEGKLNSSYGNLLLEHNDAGWNDSRVSQWEWALRSMIKDPDTRQAIMHINRPGHQEDWVKDFPCTMHLQMLLRNKELHCVASMRSNDLIFGLTFDFPLFSMFQEAFLDCLNSAAESNYSLGSLTVTAGSSHVYGRDFKTIESMLDSGITSMDPSARHLKGPLTAEIVFDDLRISRTEDFENLLKASKGEEWKDTGDVVLDAMAASL